MYPILVRIYGIPIYSYGFFLALAFFICLVLIMRRALSAGIAPHHILDLGIYLIISGIIGARLFYVLTDPDYYILRPLEIFFLNKGGLVYYGGFVTALITGIIFIKRRKLPVLKIADLVVAFLPLGQAIGRVGCFLNGCCYGKTTSSVFGIRFPPYSFAAGEFGTGHHVYPVQIYSSAVDIFIFLVLMIRMKYKRFDGQIVIYYMFLYGTARFLLEFLRADNPAVFYGFNVPQLISTGMILSAVVAGMIRR